AASLLCVRPYTTLFRSCCSPGAAILRGGWRARFAPWRRGSELQGAGSRLQGARCKVQEGRVMFPPCTLHLATCNPQGTLGYSNTLTTLRTPLVSLVTLAARLPSSGNTRPIR